MTKPIILFRNNFHQDTQQEIEVASKYLPITSNRTLCKDNLVVGRYSVLPYYREVENDLQYNNCQLINSYKQHRWIADFDYYFDYEELELTPHTYFDASHLPDDRSFIVKGRTNSRKDKWRTLFFALTKHDAIRIGCDLLDDPLISQQGIIYRDFVPLKSFGTGRDGTIYANEWRLFYYKQNLLSFGYYWSSADDQIIADAKRQGLSQGALVFAAKLATIASEQCNFFVLDIAEDINGRWWLIEINDAQMSGLSENNPEILYKNLKEALLCKNQS